MKTLIQKLSSRKLWAALVGVVTGLALIFGLDMSVVSTVSGAVVAAGAVVSYIVTEGKIDAAAVASAVEAVQTAADALEDFGDAE